jgi:acetolactate synthase-1/2/3 large subunit
VPVVTTQLAKDLLAYASPLFTGHPGVKGDRPGNFAVQNADLILSIGCSLHVQTTGWELEEFAPRAYKIQIDQDEAVLQRERVGVAQKVNCDLVSLLKDLDALTETGWDGARGSGWRQRCADWKNRYAVMREPHRMGEGPASYYEFADVLSEALQGNETIVTDAGLAFYVMGQAFRIKEEQRYIVSGAMGAMGYALPASIGVAVADPARMVVCVTGDGSLQMNVQELQTLRQNGLNVKLFVINNRGYASIRNTQKAFFAGHFVGTGPEAGVSFPPLEKLASAHDLPYVLCPERAFLRERVQHALTAQGPVVCEIVSQTDQEVIPTVSSVRLENDSLKSKPIHDMFPFMSADELRDNMCY